MEKAGASAPAVNTMAKTKTTPPADDAAGAEARALIDLPEMDVLSGELVVADAATVAALVAGGKADDHPEAVAYAKAQATQ